MTSLLVNYHKGMKADIGERGTGLSGGQACIALARLFLSQAPLLILDEVTTALDSETEQQVLQNIQRLLRIALFS